MAARATVLATAYAAHPERFPAGQPQPPARPVAVWINPPKTRATQEGSYIAIPLSCKNAAMWSAIQLFIAGE